MARDIPLAPVVTTVGAPTSLWQRLLAGFFRLVLLLLFKPLVRPPFPLAWQRWIVRLLSSITLSESGLDVGKMSDVPCGGEVIRSPLGEVDGAVLYLHGGAFCMGSPLSHRSITTYLASRSRSEVWVPDYRLAPEHPAPAALEDAVSCYRRMLMAGYSADQIVIAGDSAGAGLALSTVLKLRELDLPLPGGIVLFSPFVDLALSGLSSFTHQRIDPMLSRAWLRQGALLYAGHRMRQNPLCSPLYGEFGGLPPMLIQVGSDELLLDDAQRLAQRAAVHGARVRLTMFSGMWHVFQLLVGWIKPADEAMQQAVEFIGECRHVPITVPDSGRVASSASLQVSSL